jgi:hypothetical protein
MTKIKTHANETLTIDELVVLLQAEGTLANAAASVAKRNVGTGTTGQDYTTETDVTALLDTSEFDTDSIWNAGGYFVIPSGWNYIEVMADIRGVDLSEIRIEHANASDVEQSSLIIGGSSLSTGGVVMNHNGGGIFAVSATDRIRLYVTSADATGDVTAGSSVSIRKVG